MTKHLKPHKRVAIARKFRQGLNAKKIAFDYGIDTCYIYEIAKRYEKYLELKRYFEGSPVVGLDRVRYPTT